MKTRAVLLHDLLQCSGRGLLSSNEDSKYLLHRDLVFSAISQCAQTGVTFDELAPASAFVKKGEHVSVTIDDGGKSSLEIARFLTRFNIRGIFFIPSLYINKEGFLDSQEIIELHRLGHLIGSHSHSHPTPFCRLSSAEIKRETVTSTSILSEIIGDEVTHFSIPGGEINRKCLNDVATSDGRIRHIYTSTPRKGVYTHAAQAAIHGRLCIERTMTESRVVDIINGKGWLRNRVRYQIGRAKREAIYILGNS